MPTHEPAPTMQRAFEIQLEYAWRVTRCALRSDQETERVLRAALAEGGTAVRGEDGLSLGNTLPKAILTARPWAELLIEDHGADLPSRLRDVLAQTPEARRPDEALIAALCRAAPGPRLLVLGSLWSIFSPSSLAEAAGETEAHLLLRAAPLVQAMDAACSPLPDTEPPTAAWADPGRWGLVRAALSACGELRQALTPPPGFLGDVATSSRPA
ncbi:MAG: hypothetical protein EPN60_17265 [Nevskiaceae bacterium]|nr:MAG: hypothetical protein EPO48_11100 [Nevskiaceae bacterium]TAM22262.1 MAG: hypothetical protein EPN60_17265 [Nevskiaceae bacterium]